MEPTDSITSSCTELKEDNSKEIVIGQDDEQTANASKSSTSISTTSSSQAASAESVETVARSQDPEQPPKSSQVNQGNGPQASPGGKLTSNQASPKTKPGGVQGVIREGVELVVVTLLLLIAIRWALAEARYIPSSSMEPTLQINDRLLVEKVSGHLGKKIQRGDILVFYPPPPEMGGKDLQYDPLHVLGRLTGLPFLPYEPAFIKRVVGLPGESIRIQHGQGVYINGQLLDESQYIKERPNYDLNTLGDIGGRAIEGSVIRPYSGSEANDPIIVPPGHLFMMGDNRNNSEDSHVWGFLDQKRIVGRACLLFWRQLQPPAYPQIMDD